MINITLSSGIVIVSSALLLYLIIYNPRNSVARSFAILLACVLITYFVDLALVGVVDLDMAIPWLRFQWVGIAFTPAAYLSFSNALLITTGARSRLRDVAVRASYFFSAFLLLGAIFTDYIVRGGALGHRVSHLLPGPLFPFFVLYFFAAVGWGVANVLRARRRCLTSTSRRRMTYLMATFAAPAAGVFPYLLLTGWPAFAPGVALWLLLVLGNVGVGLMLVLLSYSVAFFGALTPDRVVKHRLIRFLLRGPLVATLVVVVVVVASQTEEWLGLSGHRLMLFGVVAVILLLQLGIELAKPLIDRALYRQDQPEIEWIQQLSNRLLTTTDLHQFLENVLTALCDLLRVRTAFVTVIDGGVPHLEVVCGPLEPGAADLPPEAWQVFDGASPGARRIEPYGDLFVWDGYWLIPLRIPLPALPHEEESTKSDLVGVVGVSARTVEPNLSPEEWAGMEVLLAQAAAALEDRQLQQGIFSALERIIPEIEDIQRRRGVLHYVGEQALSGFSLVEDAEFRQWVRDALAHYWGGPKLATSPLLSLHVVERAVQERDGNVMKGLRAVLKQAIERLRPDGQRQMTAPEWVLYNILELKFLQGRRVREIAQRLAMSESDLYRKQRVAIEAVSQTLTEMEREELSNGEVGSSP
ncbi:MAG: histidine kinase N-terminal 7TM domain-containing protein [Chloroflexota bacterium]|nr:histidine kinase N-terminal 7TM domain-containing protein [Chloroflexota bacterium]